MRSARDILKQKKQAWRGFKRLCSVQGTGVLFRVGKSRQRGWRGGFLSSKAMIDDRQNRHQER